MKFDSVNQINTMVSDVMNSKTVRLILLFLLVSCGMKKSIPFEEGFVSVNGVKLYYKSVGKGVPVIVLHGGPGLDHKHLLTMSDLAENYKVIFYDQRATGNSSGNVDAVSITVDNFIEDLEGLRKELNLEKMNVIGHSWGGLLGMYYGIKYPDNLNSLILLAPSGASPCYLNRYFANIEKNRMTEDSLALAQIKQSEAFKNQETEAIQRYWRIFLKAYFKDKSLVDNFNLTFDKNTINNQNAVSTLLMKNLGDYDIHGELSSIKCPTLIVHGDSDLLPYESSYRIHKRMLQSKLIILEGAGHFMFIESPDKLFSIIRDFLRDDKSVVTSIPITVKERLESLSF